MALESTPPSLPRSPARSAASISSPEGGDPEVVLRQSHPYATSTASKQLTAQAVASRIREFDQLETDNDFLQDRLIISNEDDMEYPLHPPTGERTRKTYDFTSMRDLKSSNHNWDVNAHKIYNFKTMHLIIEYLSVKLITASIITGTYDVGFSCHDIQASQGATKSGVYLIHPPNLSQGMQ